MAGGLKANMLLITNCGRVNALSKELASSLRKVCDVVRGGKLNTSVPTDTGAAQTIVRGDVQIGHQF